MELIGLIFRIMTFVLNFFKLVYEIHKDKKKAATDRSSDGSATK